MGHNRKWSVFDLIPSPPIPTGILTECISITNQSNTLNLELEWNTFSNMLHITSPDIWSFRLKLVPIDLSCWLTWLRKEIPTMSLALDDCRAYSNNSFTLAKKWLTGLVWVSEGGVRGAVSWVPTVLNLLFSLVCSVRITECWYISVF
jgi:hypothetical protein